MEGEGDNAFPPTKPVTRTRHNVTLHYIACLLSKRDSVKASYVHIGTLYDNRISKKREVTDSLQLEVRADNQHLTNNHSP